LLHLMINFNLVKNIISLCFYEHKNSKLTYFSSISKETNFRVLQPVDLSVHFLWVSAFIVNPSCGTCLIFSYSFHCWSGGSAIHRLILNYGHAQLIFILYCKMLMDTYPREYSKFEIWVLLSILFATFPLC
jgi:hypothetical protein